MLRRGVFWLIGLFVLFVTVGPTGAMDLPSNETTPTETMPSDMNTDQQATMPEESCPSCSITGPSCDPFHLSLCTDRESCEQAGGQWYEDQCVSQVPEKQTCLMVATAQRYHGEDILATIQEKKTLQPAPAEVGCTLLVPPEDMGQQAQLLMYAYHEGWGWIDLSSLLPSQETVLGQSVTLQIEGDLSPFAGQEFDLCCGYLTAQGDLSYHCYQLEVQAEERTKAVVLAEARPYQGEDPLRFVQKEEQVPAGPATIGCDLVVPEADRGQQAQLLLYAHHETWGWIDLSSMLETKQVVLGDLVPVTADVDLTPLRGENFVVCGGYYTAAGELAYQCYRLIVE